MTPDTHTTGYTPDTDPLVLQWRELRGQVKTKAAKWNLPDELRGMAIDRLREILDPSRPLDKLTISAIGLCLRVEAHSVTVTTAETSAIGTESKVRVDTLKVVEAQETATRLAHLETQLGLGTDAGRESDLPELPTPSDFPVE